MGKLFRSPKVENKYSVKYLDLKFLKVVDRSKLQEPLFWRNNVISAWCISGSTYPYTDNGSKDYGDESSYWLGIYDEDAKHYKGKVMVHFSAFGGMCNYVFNEFYSPSSIKSEDDLSIQEMFLEKLNYLLDNGILILDRR